MSELDEAALGFLGYLVIIFFVCGLIAGVQGYPVGWLMMVPGVLVIIGFSAYGLIRHNIDTAPERKQRRLIAKERAAELARSAAWNAEQRAKEAALNAEQLARAQKEEYRRSLTGLVDWYATQTKLIESSPLDREKKKEALISLENRYGVLLDQLMREIKP